MQLDPTKTFQENLLAFKAEAEQLDADCAKILFDNIHLLCREADGRDRAAISEFHRQVLAALEALPALPETAS